VFTLIEMRFIAHLNMKTATNFTSTVLLDKLIVTQLVKKFAVFYVIRRFITVFTRARHWSQS